MSATQSASVERLSSIERGLVDRPDDVELRYERARALDDLGRVEEAMYAYRAVIVSHPDHFAALTNLGTLFVEQARPEGAAVCFRAALAAAPGDPLAHLNLAVLAVASGSFDDAATVYERVLEQFPNDPQAQVHAHNGLARLAEWRGDAAAAQRHRDRALARPIRWTFPYRGLGRPIRVLVLTSARGGDVIGDQFFDDRVVERTAIVPESFGAADPLPQHDLIFNGIGEPDSARSTLEHAAGLVARSRARVINHPRAVLRTDRRAMMARLAAVPGLVVPRTQRFSRAGLTPERLAAAGFAFPLLVRSPGFHAGSHFEFVADASALHSTLATLPGDDVYAIAYHDASGADGWVRKYRIVFVDGTPHPVHLALARQWKVHYFSAAMAEQPEHRAEEARFLDNLADVLGADGMTTLCAVGDVLGLDYGGVDFGRRRDGALIVFEANATMTINAPPDDPHWAYRRAAHERAIAAVHAMIARTGER